MRILYLFLFCHRYVILTKNLSSKPKTTKKGNETNFKSKIRDSLIQSGPHTGADTPDFFRGPTASGGPIGAHMEDFFFFDERKIFFCPG